MARGFSIKEVADIVINGAFDVTEELVDAGRRAYCNLHQNHPAWTVARKFSDRSIILRAIDDMCDRTGYISPLPPVIPFSGGQCPTTYFVRASCEIELWNWTDFDFSSGGVVYPSVDTRDVSGLPIVGPINSMYFASLFPCPEKDPDQETCTYGGRIVYLVVNDSEAQKLYRTTLWTEGPFTGGGLTISKRNFLRRDTIANQSLVPRRTDATPDECGDPEPSYPPELPPDDSDLIQDIDVTNNAGDTYTYNVTVNRDENNTINFPATIVVNDVTMTMDVTGITIIENNNTEKPSGGDDGGVAVEEPVLVDDSIPDVTVLDDEVVEDVTEDETEDETIEYVVIEITKFPIKGKAIFQSNSDDNDYFAGYFNWTTDTSNGICRHTTEPIRKRLHIFKKPEWATGYRAYTVNQAKINVTKFKQPVED